MTIFTETPAVPKNVPRGDPVRKQLRGSSLLLAGRFLSRGINFVSQLLIVRGLTTTAYGGFAYGLAVVAFWEGLSALGLQKAITRFLPVYHERGQLARVRGAIVLVLIGIGLTSAIAIASIYLTPDLMARLVHERGPRDLLLVLIFLVPVEALDELLIGLFACFARPRAIFLRKHVVGPLLKLTVVSALTLTHADASFLARGYVAASILGFGFYAVLLVRMLRRQGLFEGAGVRACEIPSREMFAFTLPLLTTSLVPVVMHSTATMILAYFHPAAEVAKYRAILPAAQLNNIVLLSFGTLFMPAAARMFGRGDWASVRSLYWRGAAWMAVLSFPIFALTFSCARSLTLTLYGERYADGWVILQLVSGAYYFGASLGNNGLTLKVIGKLRYVVTVNFLAMAANVLLTLLLVPRFGALGTGIATATILVVHNILKQMGLRAAGIAAFDRSTVPVYAVIAAGALCLFALQLLVSQFLVLLAAAAVISLVVLVFTKHALRVEETFPELLKLPVLGWILRAKDPMPLSWRSK